MWVYNKGHIGQFGNFIFWSQPKTNSELKTWFDKKLNFYGVKKARLKKLQTDRLWKPELPEKILSADFSSSHLKSVLSSLPFCWFAQTNQTQRLNCWSLLVIHIHSGLRVFRFYFTKVQYFNCLSRVVDKSSGWLQGEELNWVFFKFWCFAWTLFVFSVFCISCMNVFYRTSPQLIIITNYKILYIKNMQLLRLVIPS